MEVLYQEGHVGKLKEAIIATTARSYCQPEDQTHAQPMNAETTKHHVATEANRRDATDETGNTDRRLHQPEGEMGHEVDSGIYR